MKTITKNQNAVFALILGLAISLSVSGQTSKKFNHPDKMEHRTHFISDKTIDNDFNTLNESWQLPYKSTQGSIPQEIHHFYWAPTSVWMTDYNRMDSYSTSGKILSEIYVDANTSDTTNGIFYSYDNQGRLDYILNQNWVSGNWENNTKKMYSYDVYGNDEVYLELAWTGTGWNETYGIKWVYTYDANNHITAEILQYWDTVGDFWFNYDRYLYNYDANGYVTEFTVQWWINNDWGSQYKELYTLSSSGVITEMIQQNWNNNNWVNYSNRVDMVWHVWNGYFNEWEIESYLEKLWTSGVWNDSRRVSTTYDAYGGSIQLEEYYLNNAWVNTYKHTYTFDTHSNATGYTHEWWTGFTWTIDFGYKYILTYDGNDVIERIYQDYDHVMMVWVNSDKEQYSDFIYTQGIIPGSALGSGITIYPNPSTGLFYIDTETTGMDIQSVDVISLSGQVVYQRQLNETSPKVCEIDLTNCTKGIYFIKLQDVSGIKVGKVIIQ